MCKSERKRECGWEKGEKVSERMGECVRVRLRDSVKVWEKESVCDIERKGVCMSERKGECVRKPSYWRIIKQKDFLCYMEALKLFIRKINKNQTVPLSTVAHRDHMK